MAIPFYENEEQTQQQASAEIDQVDGPTMTAQSHQQHHGFSSPYVNEQHSENVQLNHDPITQEDLMAWQILALAMCKALKDHYQQNMTSTTTPATNTAPTNGESSTAVIQILPNGQGKPQWQ